MSSLSWTTCARRRGTGCTRLLATWRSITRFASMISTASSFDSKDTTYTTCAAPTITEGSNAADTPTTDASRRDAAEGVPRTARCVTGRGGATDEDSVPAPQRDRQGPARRERRHRSPFRSAHGLGGADLAVATGEMGSVARAAGTRAAPESASPQADGLRSPDKRRDA